MNDNNIPNFAAWTRENLDSIAHDLYIHNRRLREANEQLWLDLKDAMKLVRANLLEKDDWK